MSKSYLVLYCCTIDDFPVAVFNSAISKTPAVDAYEYAKNFTEDDPVVAYLEDQMSLDASSGVCMKVITFDEGVPTEVQLVKMMDEEIASPDAPEVLRIFSGDGGKSIAQPDSLPEEGESL